MSGTEISGLAAITSVQPDDLLVVVDVHDTTMAPTGTDKKMQLEQLYGLAPWQFTPENFGAAGNGKVIGDATVAGGALSTLTSASAGFTSADTGKSIMVNGGAGAEASPLITTITFVNSTTVTLASAASGAISSASAVYGTDDTTAINNCVTAASNFAQGISGSGAGFGQNFAEIILGSKIYCLASGPTQTGDGATTPTFNSQIPLPYPAANGTSAKLALQFTGAGEAANPQYYYSAIASFHGSVLMSMVLAPGSGGSATYGAQSVIGGPTGTSGFETPGGFANILSAMDGVIVGMPWGAQQTAIDFRYCACASVPDAAVMVFAPHSGTGPLLGDTTHWANVNAGGLNMPVQLNNNQSFVGQFLAQGVAGVGCSGSEHFNIQRLTIDSCNFGLYVRDFGGTVIHGGSVLYFSCENTHTALIAQASTSTQFPINIGLMDTEVIDTSDITDSDNILTGVIHWADYERTTMNVTGAANLKIINDRLGPGAWSGAPAVPSSGSAQQNTAWRDATVYISGTLTGNTEVDGNSLGVAATVVRVPSGHTITVTYVSAPTWVWVLD